MKHVEREYTPVDSKTGVRHDVKVSWPAGLTLTNSPKGTGVLVVKVIRNNGAFQAGIRAGDVILRVNGTQVRDHTTAVEFIEQRCRVGDCMLDVQSNQVDVLFRQPSVFLRRISTGVTRIGRGRTSPQGGHSDSGDEQAVQDEDIGTP